MDVAPLRFHVAVEVVGKCHPAVVAPVEAGAGTNKLRLWPGACGGSCPIRKEIKHELF